MPARIRYKFLVAGICRHENGANSELCQIFVASFQQVNQRVCKYLNGHNQSTSGVINDVFEISGLYYRTNHEHAYTANVVQMFLFLSSGGEVLILF